MRVLFELKQCCLHWRVRGLPHISQPEVPWLCSRRTSRLMSLLWHQCTWSQEMHQGWSSVRMGALGPVTHHKPCCSCLIQLWTICSLKLVSALFLVPAFVFWQPSAQQSDATGDEFEGKGGETGRGSDAAVSSEPCIEVLCPTLQCLSPTAESIPNILRKAP